MVLGILFVGGIGWLSTKLINEDKFKLVRPNINNKLYHHKDEIYDGLNPLERYKQKMHYKMRSNRDIIANLITQYTGQIYPTIQVKAYYVYNNDDDNKKINDEYYKYDSYINIKIDYNKEDSPNTVQHLYVLYGYNKVFDPKDFFKTLKLRILDKIEKTTDKIEADEKYETSIRKIQQNIGSENVEDKDFQYIDLIKYIDTKSYIDIIANYYRYESEWKENNEWKNAPSNEITTEIKPDNNGMNDIKQYMTKSSQIIADKAHNLANKAHNLSDKAHNLFNHNKVNQTISPITEIPNTEESKPLPVIIQPNESNQLIDNQRDVL